MSADRLDFLRHDHERLAHLLPEMLSEAERNAVLANWPLWARASQLPPPGDWRVWLIMAGRGFGKTRAGAEWVRMVAERDHSARIALVASSLHEARSVMVEKGKRAHGGEPRNPAAALRTLAAAGRVAR